MTKESRVLENDPWLQNKPLVESKIQESTDEALTEEDYWENFSLTVTQDIQTETEEGHNPAEPTLGNIPTNNQHEVDYDSLDQNINLANQSNLFNWDSVSFWNRD